MESVAELHLPPQTQLEFVAEGAANIIYRIQALPSHQTTPPTAADLHAYPHPVDTSDTTPPPSSISPPTSRPETPTVPPGYLLRLRKAVPHLPSTSTAHALRDRLIAPLFPASLVLSDILIQLPPDLVPRLNTSLRTMELADSRKSRRRGTYHAEDESLGMLVTDMTTSNDESDVVIELKPKWLVQSPDAPSGATRCRTCALRASRYGSNAPAEMRWCPLDLASGEREAVERAVAGLTAGYEEQWLLRGLSTRDVERVRQKAVDYVLASDTVSRLRNVQVESDRTGVLGLREEEEISENLSIAYTLRDCTIFMKVPIGEGSVEGKLGDLDFKTAEMGKLKYWQDIETMLRASWYSAGKREGNGLCRLQRGMSIGS